LLLRVQPGIRRLFATGFWSAFKDIGAGRIEFQANLNINVVVEFRPRAPVFRVMSATVR
jgi:hypothetical protein